MSVGGGSLLRSPFPWLNTRLIIITADVQTCPEYEERVKRLLSMQAYLLRHGVPEEECQFRLRFPFEGPREGPRELALYAIVGEGKKIGDILRKQCKRLGVDLIKSAGPIPEEDPHDLLRSLLTPLLQIFEEEKGGSLDE